MHTEPPGELVNHNVVKQNWIGIWATVFLASSLGDSGIHQRLRITDLRNSFYQLAESPGEGADRRLWKCLSKFQTPPASELLGSLLEKQDEYQMY